MADIVIRGVEMPLCKTELIVFPSGVVQVYDSRENYLGKAEAVPLPAGHGRLIDADALIANHFSDEHRIALSPANKLWMRRIINGEHTIIPAEGGTEDA